MSNAALNTSGSSNTSGNSNTWSSPSRVSCRPDQLDHFVDASLHGLVGLRLSTDRLNSAWVCAVARCLEPTVPTPPSGAVLQHLSRAVADARFVAETAHAFRRAEMNSLVNRWAGIASLNYLLAVTAGERVPAIRADWTLLRFSTADKGRLVEVRGDLAAATHIVVMVPGMTNELANIDENFRRRADRLYEELIARAKPGEQVAVVMWLGYRNPSAFPEAPLAATSAMARRGAVTLNADLAAIRATGTNAQITVVAHSYGTVVAGEAMDRGIAADRVVVVGSPGMNALSRASLGSPTTKLYASSVGTQPSAAVGVIRTIGSLASGNRPVGLMAVDIATGRDWAAATSHAGLHGADPAQPGFGATPFSSSGSGHSAYFDLRSLGLANIALVSLGRQPVKRLSDAGPRRRRAVMTAGKPRSRKSS